MNEKAQRCVGCAAEPPASNGDSTLVSARGWRLTAAVGEGGSKLMQWRCPTCWARYRRRLNLAKAT